MTRKTKKWALKKIEICIDKMVDLKDEGYGCENVERILERLNNLQTINSEA